MENKRAILISLLCGGFALILIFAFVQVRRSELTSEFGDEMDVVIAAKEISEYEIITENMLTTAKVFKNFRQPQTVGSIRDIVGKAAYVPIYAGEQITLTKLVNQDGKPVLDRQVERKMRAITIPITPNTGVGRLIRPGNRVDLLATPNYDSNGSTTFEVKTLIQNALVLATGKNIQNSVPTRVDRNVLGFLEEEMEKKRRKDWSGNNIETLNTSRPDDNYAHITVELTPDEAEKVLYIMHVFGDMRIYFTLRNSADSNIAKLETTILDEILGPDSDYGKSLKKPPPAAPPPEPKVKDVVGGQEVPRY